MVVGSGLTRSGVIEKPNVSVTSMNVNPSSPGMDAFPMSLFALNGAIENRCLVWAYHYDCNHLGKVDTRNVVATLADGFTGWVSLR